MVVSTTHNMEKKHVPEKLGNLYPFQVANMNMKTDLFSTTTYRKSKQKIKTQKFTTKMDPDPFFFGARIFKHFPFQ